MSEQASQAAAFSNLIFAIGQCILVYSLRLFFNYQFLFKFSFLFTRYEGLEGERAWRHKDKTYSAAFSTFSFLFCIFLSS